MAAAGPSSSLAPALLIFPYNGNGIEAIDCLGDRYRLVSFFDDTPAKQGTGALGFVVGDRSVLTRWADASVLAVPGSPATFRTRRHTIEGLAVDPRRFARVIHPSARVSPLATIGYNVLIMAGVVVTSNAVVGNHVCVLPNTVIHHDVRIGDWSLIGSNVTLAGGAHVDDNCYIGSGSSVMNGLHIGTGTLVGLSSNVIRSLPPGSKAAGNPARPLP